MGDTKLDKRHAHTCWTAQTGPGRSAHAELVGTCVHAFKSTCSLRRMHVAGYGCVPASWS